MPVVNITNFGGLDLYTNPLQQPIGALIKSVNVDPFPYGAKTKRLGSEPFLNNPGSAKVTSMWQFEKNDGTTSFHYLYMAQGTSIYYWDVNGTLATWTPMGNGSIQNGATVNAAVLNNYMILGDGVGSTRHTTNGTSLTDTDGAPVSSSFAEYGGRMYAGGTANYITASSPTDVTNWSNSGTSTSFDIFIPGPGKNLALVNSDDRLLITKTSQRMYRWDNSFLVDMGTDAGPTSPVSIAEREGYHFWINYLGNYGFGGDRPQLLSNAVQRQFYGSSGGVFPSDFPEIPGVTYRFAYMASLGDISDDFTDTTIENCILCYDYQKNEYYNYSLPVKPTAWVEYLTPNSSPANQLIFGSETGQCYNLFTGNTDDGDPIECELQGFFHGGDFSNDKEFTWIGASFNPGCQAKMQVALTDAYNKGNKRWYDIGDLSRGVVNFRFPPDANRGKFLFWKVYESSTTSPFSFYGMNIEYNVIPK